MWATRNCHGGCDRQRGRYTNAARMLQGFAETAALTVAAYDSPSKRLIARLMWVNFI